MCKFSDFFKKRFNTEKPDPSDIVPRDSIMFLEDVGQISIDLKKLNIPFTKTPKVWIPSIPDTGSMEPAFDAGHNNILIAGVDKANQAILVDFLKVGDIAVYKIPNLIYAIHRIVKIEWDDEGRFFTFRGDNNSADDPYPVWDKHIQWLSLGTIY